MSATPVQDKWAWVAGVAAAALGLAAHVIAGGSAPAVPVLLAFAALCGLAAQLLARWIHGPLLLLLVSGVAQQLLHLGFDSFGGYFPGTGFLEHLHGAGQVPEVAGEAAPSPGTAHASDLMLYTHVAAAILTLLVGAGVAKVARRSWRVSRSASSRQG
ncbi:hypothetical protein ACFRJ9_13475 [Paenarthrobacter sp. NPDC056912]|uniref:hypothetical protein n=1 Tax=Paenarthrobacter sp. NPDC056912 TaxID=3345965 RepID=UPI00366B9C5B